MTSTAAGRPPLALLVHGAWHSAAVWGHVAAALTARGVASLAVDLPGCGLDARVPAAYLRAGQPGLASEPSPLADVGADDVADRVHEAIVAAAGRYEVTVVVHSAGGGPASVAVERNPELVVGLVYVSAFCPAGRPLLADSLATDAAQGALGGDLLLGDPAELGALRINPASDDPAYVEGIRAAYFSDLPADRFTPWRRMLTPDWPVSVPATPATVTAERWGSVPRTFVCCDADRVAPPALQQLWIDEADAAAPDHRFTVRHLPTGHAPFATAPDELADIVAAACVGAGRG